VNRRAIEPAPRLRRRLASLMYEALLLFGLAFGVAFGYALATRQQHALQGRTGLLVAMAIGAGLYFVWCWTRSGQTLPMQTWQLRLVSAGGGRVSVPRAVWRYLLCWLWFLPALGLSALLGWQGQTARVGLMVLAGVGLYGALAWVLPGRQFLHDLLAGTRLVAAGARG